MATALVVSIGFCIWVMLGTYTLDYLKKRNLNVRMITKLLFGASLFMISACFTILGVAAAYYFDYDQTYDTAPIVKAGAWFSVTAMILGIMAIASLMYKK